MIKQHLRMASPTDKMDIMTALAAFEMSLGNESLLGKGVRAAQRIFVKGNKK